MHCKGMNQVSFICIILLLYFRKQILSQHQQESVYLEKVMFSMEKHYTDLDSRNQIKKTGTDFIMYTFIQMLLSKATYKCGTSQTVCHRSNYIHRFY